jgi:hypothetical protein
MNKDIKNFDENGNCHGYQERYSGITPNKLLYRVNYKRGNEIGYEEWHDKEYTSYYIK